MSLLKFKKILVANRGEIAIRIFRACSELQIRTVAIYAKQDELSLHRFKADEAYLVGEGKGPIEAYLDIEDIISIAKRNEVDAIHPGYGFLAENEKFARRCLEEGIAFIGPKAEHLRMFGDKLEARLQAAKAGIPVLPGTNKPVNKLEEIKDFATKYGYPIIIKAAAGGGGRGMRIVSKEEEVKEAFERACSEANASFGNPAVYLEYYLENPKHIEVQILGDYQGNIVHLFERDCSVQRRHQKLVEVAPSVAIDEELRTKLCDAAVRLMKQVNYVNAGTVEFLVSGKEFYFIEINPRIQVEHTITEMVTGIDIVQAQIKIAAGYRLDSPEIGICSQNQITRRGYAIQCRVTTEDPENDFAPDSGRILVYRTSGGFGTRLDGGNGFTGANITPYYDSLLVKISVWALTYEQAVQKMIRNLRETRIRGVKTNIPFLENVIHHKSFRRGEYNTNFVNDTPELFEFKLVRDRGTKLLHYLGEVTINGYQGIERQVGKPDFAIPTIPKLCSKETSAARDITLSGTKQILEQEGSAGLIAWIKNQKNLLITDTTFRDAHQSLYATRFRTRDFVNIAESTSRLIPNLFSLEMWGGATFDVSMRFLKEDPWERLRLIRDRMPNILLQMLLRGANAVGYKSYPDNVINRFVKETARQGIDVFRIFDSLNWLEGMRFAIDSVLETGKIAEVAICYTGDIHDPQRKKYNLDYYINLAKEIEKTGAHILAIKDMAGLLKPFAAYDLISALKNEVDMPIHIHTHDLSGNGIAMYLEAFRAGADIVDVAISTMSGLTSQPSFNALVAALERQKGCPEFSLEYLNLLSNYWEKVRSYYQAFDSGIKSTSTEVYFHEMPGGQYSNLQQQAKAIGLANRWDEIKRMYQTVNMMFGDIVKVTPSSKVVGDMALFMVQNDLTEEDIYHRGETLDFPDSVVQFFQGQMGKPYQGFPQKLQRIILKGKEPLTCRPGKMLEPIDFNPVKSYLEVKFACMMEEADILSYLMYPQIFEEFQNHRTCFSEVSVLDTPSFFYGMRQGEEIRVEIEKGKVLIIKLLYVSDPQEDGTRTLYFELNGRLREITVVDKSVVPTMHAREKADPAKLTDIGASMPGTVSKVLVKEGDRVKQGENLILTEAMKMETTIQAHKQESLNAS